MGPKIEAVCRFTEATGKPAASYGIFSSNSRGPGTFKHTYASNMNDSSYYIGACSDCNQVLTNAHAQYSALGYSGTNSGGRLIVGGKFTKRLQQSGMAHLSADQLVRLRLAGFEGRKQ